MAVAAPADRRFRRAQVKPTRRKASWLSRVAAVVRVVTGIAFFVGGGYLLTQQVADARSLRVDRITVRGTVHLRDGEVLAVLDGLKGQHVLRVSLEWWRRRLLESPWVEQAALRRVLPSTIEVVIRERQPMAIGRVNGELYLVDASGHIIDEYGPAYAQLDLPIVDGIGSAPAAGEPLVDDRRAALTGRLIASLRRSEALYRRVSQIDVSNDRDAVVMLDGDRALLHLGDDQFVERLQSYIDLGPALHEQVPEIDYVDLRFENRVYVRPAGSPARHRNGAR